jgi:hypothetical protein
MLNFEFIGYDVEDEGFKTNFTIAFRFGRNYFHLQ